jgi:hypothetical protein
VQVHRTLPLPRQPHPHRPLQPRLGHLPQRHGDLLQDLPSRPAQADAAASERFGFEVESTATSPRPPRASSSCRSPTRRARAWPARRSAGATGSRRCGTSSASPRGLPPGGLRRRAAAALPAGLTPWTTCAHPPSPTRRARSPAWSSSSRASRSSLLRLRARAVRALRTPVPRGARILAGVIELLGGSALLTAASCPLLVLGATMVSRSSPPGSSRRRHTEPHRGPGAAGGGDVRGLRARGR